jgi:hypothetical protein
VVVVELVLGAAVVVGGLVVVGGGRVVLGAAAAGAVVGGAVGTGAGAALVGAGRSGRLVVVVALRRTLVSGAAVEEAGAAWTVVAGGQDAPGQARRGSGFPNACRPRIATIAVAATPVAVQGRGRRDTSVQAARAARSAARSTPPAAARRGGAA